MTSLESFFPDGESWGLVVDTSDSSGHMVAFSNFKTQALSWEPPLKHSEQVNLKFEEILQSRQIHHLSKIYFFSGPGSFTGLRVSAAFLKALSCSTKANQIFCLSSFLPTAYKVSQNTDLKEFCVMIPSVGDRVFLSTFKKKNNQWHEKIEESGASQNHFLQNELPAFSSHLKLCQKKNQITHMPYLAKDLTELLKDLENWQAYTKVSTYLDLYPLYLRKSEAEEKLRYGILK